MVRDRYRLCSESEARGKLKVSRNRSCPKTNIRAYFKIKTEAIEFIMLRIFFRFQRAQLSKLSNLFCQSKRAILGGVFVW